MAPVLPHPKNKLIPPWLILWFGLSLTAWAGDSWQTNSGKRLSEHGNVAKFEAEILVGTEEGDSETGVHRAILGEKINVTISFMNPSVDQEGKSGVLLDCIFRRPDGSIVEEIRNCYGWTVKKPAPRGEMLDAECCWNFQPERDELPGIYTLEVSVKDMPGKRKVLLESKVDFREKNP